MKFSVRLTVEDRQGPEDPPVLEILKEGVFYADNEDEAKAKAEEQWTGLLDDLDGNNTGWDLDVEEEWG